MKRWLIFAASGLFLLCVAVVSGKVEPTALLTLRLIDAETGKTLPGVVRIIDQDGKILNLPVVSEGGRPTQPLLSRGLGLMDQPAINQWSVLKDCPVTFRLPSQQLTIEAFSGLETELASQKIDLSTGEAKELSIPLRRFYDAKKQNLRSANTHLHLMKLDREQSDRYLSEIPPADGLDVLFVSYLERAGADRDYITNRYTRTDLERLQEISGTVLGNGEEHRHNLPQQQGYGHVMLLNLQELIQPVSIGQDIARTGTDGIPLQRGIDQARRDGATTIWCHNTMGLERFANLVTGRLHAQNIFDGGPNGSFNDGFYRSLNAGLNVPFSTGTDWFIYDLSRTYVKMHEPLTTSAWLTALAAGRSYITNGPFLEFQVDGREPGDTFELQKPTIVTVEARAIGRVDFERIEVIQNGRVIRTQNSRQEARHFVAALNFELPIGEASWLALRTPPPPLPGDPELSVPVPLNEYGRPLFAHTSAVNMQYNGRRYFNRSVAQGIIGDMRESLRTIDERATFADATERARVIEVHQQAISEFERRLAKLPE